MYIKVLINVCRVGRSRNDNDAALPVPAQDHLRHRHTMRLGNRGELRVCEQLGVVAPSAKRIPALGNDTQVLDLGHDILLLVVGMNLVLHEGGNGSHLRKERFQCRLKKDDTRTRPSVTPGGPCRKDGKKRIARIGCYPSSRCDDLSSAR